VFKICIAHLQKVLGNCGDRFLSILRMLHFSNKEEQTKEAQVHKVHGVFNKFLAVFQDIFTPFQEIYVDVSLVLFKGRLKLQTLHKNKKA
jgi:hypothetical protein